MDEGAARAAGQPRAEPALGEVERRVRLARHRADALGDAGELDRGGRFPDGRRRDAAQLGRLDGDPVDGGGDRGELRDQLLARAGVALVAQQAPRQRLARHEVHHVEGRAEHRGVGAGEVGAGHRHAGGVGRAHHAELDAAVALAAPARRVPAQHQRAALGALPAALDLELEAPGLARRAAGEAAQAVDAHRALLAARAAPRARAPGAAPWPRASPAAPRSPAQLRISAGLRERSLVRFLWWASRVPPPISRSLASRHRRSTTYSPM